MFSGDSRPLVRFLSCYCCMLTLHPLKMRKRGVNIVDQIIRRAKDLMQVQYRNGGERTHRRLAKMHIVLKPHYIIRSCLQYVLEKVAVFRARWKDSSFLLFPWNEKPAAGFIVHVKCMYCPCNMELFRHPFRKSQICSGRTVERR